MHPYVSHLISSRRMQLMNRLGYLHHFGVAHGDFREPNVLDNNGVPFIVDFEHAVDHDCGCARELVIWGDLTPYRSDFDCDKLYDFALEIGVWMSSTSYLILLLILSLNSYRS